MNSQQFIFSNDRKFILARHLSFWIFFSVVCFITGAYPYKPKDLLTPELYLVSLKWVVCFIPISVLSTYLLLHFLPVLYTKKDFIIAPLAILAGIILNILIVALCNTLLLSPGGGSTQEVSENLQLAYFHSLVFTILLASVITAILVIKGWYLQITENTNLYKQKIQNERNILKSQVYPTFLFNSLNTLYQQIGLSQENAARLLLNLSDILSYILYDAGDELVQLNKELVTIRNYIEIVKKERGNTIVLKENITEELRLKFIPPLMIFGILENVLSEAYQYATEEVYISVTEKNSHLEFALLYDFKNSVMSKQHLANIMKAIENRLKPFKKATEELNMSGSNGRFTFFTKIELSDSFKI